MTLPEESFAKLFPNIANELHPTKNRDFNPFAVRPKSNTKVWWKSCNGHEWQQAIHHRVMHNVGCKECKRIENSLLNNLPDLAKEWHYEKNGNLKPNDVSKSSKLKVWWKCLNDPAHEWEMRIETRVRNKSGCPICNKSSQKKGKLPTLDIYDPILSKQWHPTKNGNLAPAAVTPGMSKKVWWVCPTNNEHVWEASICNRVKGRGCPYCANFRVTRENSLQI